MKSFLVLLLSLTILIADSNKTPFLFEYETTVEPDNKMFNSTPIVLKFEPDLKDIEERHEELYQETYLSIGKPPRRIILFIHSLGHEQSGLHINIVDDPYGLPNVSSTFKWMNQDGGNITAEDVVRFPDGHSKCLPFEIYNPLSIISNLKPSIETDISVLYLSRPSGEFESSFIGALLRDYNEKIVVITYERNKLDLRRRPGIQLTFGGQPEGTCDHWHYMETSIAQIGFSHPNEWIIELDGLKIDDKQVNLTNKLATFALTDADEIAFGKPDDENIISSLLDGKSRFDDTISKLKSKKITYQIGGLEFKATFQPRNFYKPRINLNLLRNKNDKEPLPETPNYTMIVYRALYDKCLLLDYENKRVGVANRF